MSPYRRTPLLPVEAPEPGPPMLLVDPDEVLFEALLMGLLSLVGLLTCGVLAP